MGRGECGQQQAESVCGCDGHVVWVWVMRRVFVCVCDGPAGVMTGLNL